MCVCLNLKFQHTISMTTQQRSSIELYQLHSTQAYENLNCAMTLEGEGQLTRALHMYDLGIQHIRQALQISLASFPNKYFYLVAMVAFKFTTRETIKQTNSKMRQYLILAQGRIEELRRHPSLKAPQPPSNEPLPAAMAKTPQVSVQQGLRFDDEPGVVLPKRKEPEASIGASKTANISRSMKNVDAKLANMILDEILEASPQVSWDDIGRLREGIFFLLLGLLFC